MINSVIQQRLIKLNDRPIFSCQAEFPQDVDAFLSALQKRGITFRYTRQGNSIFPDVWLEIQAGTTLEVLQEILLTIEDSHVMKETLKATPLAENDLKRNWERNR